MQATSPQNEPPASRRAMMQSRRVEAADDRVLHMRDDDAGTAAVGISLGIVIAIVVVFIGYNVVTQQRAQASTNCETAYPVATEAAQNAKCNQDADNFVTFGGLGLLIAVIAGTGLWGKKNGMF